jgi:integrase
MRIEWLPTEYLLHGAIVSGRSRSMMTWKAHGHMMVPFLNFMLDRGFDWRSPTEEQLAHYRNALEKRGIGRARIHRVMTFVCAFYEWARLRKHLCCAALPYERVVSKNRGLLAHVNEVVVSARASLVPRVPRRSDLPRFFNREEQERILSRLDQRDRLIVQWALYTGAREYEICNLMVGDIPPQTAYRSRHSFALRILGKGHKIADLYVPTWLLDETYRYVSLSSRRVVSKKATWRARRVPANIFLGRWGTALEPDSVYRNFKKALSALGLRGTFHDLRHTYAICTLDALMRVPRHEGSDGRNALIELKARMRHASVETTEIYLRARDFYFDEIESDLWAAS